MLAPPAVKVTAVPAQVVGEFTVTVGFGLTVMVYVEPLPTQPFNVGVTVIVPDIAVVPALVAVKTGTLLLPLATKPIAVFELIHVKEAPAGELVNEDAATLAPGQTEKFAGTVAVGMGLIVKDVEAGVEGGHSLPTVKLIVFTPVVENVAGRGVAKFETNPAGTLDHE